jgi:Family of unknown function (DUF6328)
MFPSHREVPEMSSVIRPHGAAARSASLSRPSARARAPNGRRDDHWNTERRGEGRLQRADRNFNELLQELRVAQIGVQILFAFLLGLSFAPRFSEIGQIERDVYVATLIFSALTVALLVAPVAAHRLQFQHGRKVELVRFGHRCALAGLAALVLTTAGSLLLGLGLVVGTGVAASVTAAVAACFIVLWFVLPLVKRGGPHPGARRR